MATGNLLFAMRPEKGDTPASIRRKRELADAIMGRRSQGARNVGEGIGSAFESIGDGIAARIMNKRADASEQAGLASVEADMDPINAGLAGFPAAPGGDSVASAPVDYASQRVAQAHGGGNYRDAIASIESAGSGDYAAIGPTHPKLGRALGRYQVMEANIGPWSREALGREVTPDAFLADPKLQDAIFDSKFGGYVKQFGSPEAAAQAWFGGPGGVGKTDRKDVLGTTIGQYGEKFNKALGGQGQPMSSPAPVQVASLDPAAGMSAPEQPAPALPAPRMVPDMPIAAPQPAPAPQQVAQAQDPSSLPVTAGGTAGAIQPGQSAGPSLQQLLQAAQNPWLNDSQRAVINTLIEREMQTQDPMRQLQLEKGQLEIEKLRNPGPDIPDSVQALDLRAQRAGLQPGTKEYSEFMTTGGNKGITVDARQMGNIPPGYKVEYDEQGRAVSMAPIPGSPDALKADAATAASGVKSAQESRYGNVVVEDIDRAVGAIEKSPWFTTGLLGSWMSGVGGTSAHKVSRLLETVKANAGFDRLQAMRDSSPTGGALGAVNQSEMSLLQSAIGNLEQSQDAGDLTYNLRRVQDIYNEIIHGAGGAPKPAGDAANKPLTDLSDEELEAIINGQ